MENLENDEFNLGYREAGVDRDVSNEAKFRISQVARSTFSPDVIGEIGGFGSLYKLNGFKNPVLVSHTDSVGTKIRIGASLGRYESLGLDIVHHCVNDIFTCGAKPLFFLDYIAMGRLVPDRVASLVDGMAAACRTVGCSLIGGETAEMPGIYQGDDTELVGFVVGAVEQDKLVDGSNIVAGDVLLGLPSSVLHTNGFSLVRRIFETDRHPSNLYEEITELGCTLGEALLVPHRCYYPLLLPVLQYVKAMAHITGGGLIENVPRVLPNTVAAHFWENSWEIPQLFKFIQQRGNVSLPEMYRVFNMGIGMVLVVDSESVASVQNVLSEVKVIGTIAELNSGEKVRIGVRR